MAVSLTLRPVTSTDLSVFESPMVQGPNAQVIYALTTTEVGSDPSSPTVTAVNRTTGKTVTAQVLSGSASVSGDVVTLPTVQNLVAGNNYRIYIRFTIASTGTPFERYLDIRCQN